MASINDLPPNQAISCAVDDHLLEWWCDGVVWGNAIRCTAQELLDELVSGEDAHETCETCEGSGVVGYDYYERECPDCEGLGKVLRW